MDLQVIGPAFGRTGTMSFKEALDQLGFGPTYHMFEVYEHTGHTELWTRAIHGGRLDLDTLFAGYRSVVDWPACSFWKQIKAAHPKAKVVLTQRDPDSWFDSITHTVFQAIRSHSEDENLNLWRVQTRKLILEDTFGNDLSREHVIKVMRGHERDVIASVPRNELLLFDVADGWEPLCAFLDVPVPDTPFPHANAAADFRVTTGLDQAD
jgi:sulfotransferase family protein